MITNKKLTLIVASLLLLFTTACNTPSFGSNKVEKKYYTGGKLRSEFVWSDNTGQNGIKRTYGYEGRVTSSVKVANGVNNGMMTYFDHKGRVIKQSPYVNGQIHGLEQEFYPNGDKMVTYTYVHNMRNGPAYSYYPDGKVHRKANFKNNRLVN